MINRVATFAMNRQMLDATMQTQTRMANMQLQEASGLVSTDYGGLGSDARKLIDLEVTATRSARYEASAKSASSDVDAIYAVMQSVVDLLGSLRSQVVAAQGASTADTSLTALETSAKSSMEELASLLNTKLADRYLFAGDNTQTQPVNATTLLAATDPDGSYYEGSATALSAKVSDQQVVSYGATANDPAFSAAFSAMSKLANATTMTSEELTAAYDQLVGAIDGVADIQGSISVSAIVLDRASAHQQDLNAFYSEQIVSLRDVDITEIAARLTAYETQLQASYSAIAKLQALSLTDYLR